jgi:hypothetical protein
MEFRCWDEPRSDDENRKVRQRGFPFVQLEFKLISPRTSHAYPCHSLLYVILSVKKLHLCPSARTCPVNGHLVRNTSLEPLVQERIDEKTVDDLKIAGGAASTMSRNRILLVDAKSPSRLGGSSLCVVTCNTHGGGSQVDVNSNPLKLYDNDYVFHSSTLSLLFFLSFNLLISRTLRVNTSFSRPLRLPNQESTSALSIWLYVVGTISFLSLLSITFPHILCKERIIY